MLHRLGCACIVEEGGFLCLGQIRGDLGCPQSSWGEDHVIFICSGKIYGGGVRFVTKVGLRDVLCSAPDSCGQLRHMWTGGWGWKSNMTRG